MSVKSYNKIDNEATCKVLAEIYNYQTESESTATFPFEQDIPLISDPAYSTIYEVSNDMFPESGDPKWEMQLNGTNSLYLQENTDYPALMMLLYQINMNNDNNPYFLALNISKYIYYRLGISKYVFVTDNISEVEKSFILSINSLGNTMLNSGFFSEPDEVNVYVLTDGTAITDINFQNELSQFCNKIIKPIFRVNVYFDHSAADFGMYDISYTYQGDYRQNNIACLAFNGQPSFNVLGKSSYFAYSRVIDFDIDITNTIPLLSVLSGGVTQDLAYVSGTEQDAYYSSNDDTNLTVGSIYQVWINTNAPTPSPEDNALIGEYYSTDGKMRFFVSDGVQYVQPISSGETEILIYFLNLNKTYTYTIV